MQQNGESLYERYMRVGRRVEIVGAGAAAVCAAASLIMGGNDVMMLMVFVGLLIFGFGSMNLRPNNVIKGFAVQLQMAPDTDLARALLEAMEKYEKLRMPRRLLSRVELAIAAYVRSADADKELAEKLTGAFAKRLKKPAA